jgi:sec-independent protein translocase protein TatA
MISGSHTAFPVVLGFGFPGGYEWVILLVLGLLIFGRRLPEVGRSLGKSIVEFKRGIKGIEDEIDTESSRSTTPEVSASHPAQELPRTSAPAEPVVPFKATPAEAVETGASEETPEAGTTDSDRVSG